ncbi:hypothetical protein F4V43_18290 [Paenibacillus spiritus]|uniref:Uncharacterized protein n=1 Tax=Paenibacillus spiritus TaxID=2496557 RepID=A0A5J5FUM9_9BACL|nr:MULTISPECIES: hypothetical protein [Paenibacillus]KAA8997239.1 hypothetical protein F4V43_18290 [Paenibacillus spiritus]
MTQQGDLISTYHTRYYILPETGVETEPEHAVDAASLYEVLPAAGSSGSAVQRRMRLNPFKPWLMFTGRSANRA